MQNNDQLGSCDIEPRSNDNENSARLHQNKLHFKIENSFFKIVINLLTGMEHVLAK